MRTPVKQLLELVKATLSAMYGDRLVRLVLFGSQARGDDEPGSDIDLLVVLKGPVDPLGEGDRLLDRIVDWNLEYGELVCCIYMDEERFLTRNGPLLRNIRREGTVL